MDKLDVANAGIEGTRAYLAGLAPPANEVGINRLLGKRGTTYAPDTKPSPGTIESLAKGHNEVIDRLAKLEEFMAVMQSRPF